jgi:hypothetical protein
MLSTAIASAFTDPFGHIWMLATPEEVATPEDLYRRMLGHFGETQSA